MMKQILQFLVCILAFSLYGGGKLHSQTTVSFGTNSSYIKDASNKCITIHLNTQGDLEKANISKNDFNGYNYVFITADGVQLTTADINVIQNKFSYNLNQSIIDFHQAKFEDDLLLSALFTNRTTSPAFVMPKNSFEALSSVPTPLFAMETEDKTTSIYFQNASSSFQKAITWQDYLKNSTKITILGKVNSDMDFSSCSDLQTLEITSATFSNNTSKVTVPESITLIDILEGFDISRIYPESARQKIKITTPKADPYQVNGCFITINLDEETTLETAYTHAINVMHKSSPLLAENNPCEIVINGNITPTDLAYFKNLKTEYLDLTNATFIDDDSEPSDAFAESADFANSYIKYLIFPIGKESLVTEDNVKRFTALNAAGTYSLISSTTDGKKYSLTAYVNKAGELHDLTGGITGIGSIKKENKQTDSNKKSVLTSFSYDPNLSLVKSIKLSGTVNANDLAASNSVYTYDDNGHLAVKSSADANGNPINQMVSAETDNIHKRIGALQHAQFQSVDYSGIRFSIKKDDSDKEDAQNDLSFSLLGGYANVTEFKLPTDKSIYRVPRNAFDFGTRKLKSLYIPSNFTELGASCFAGNNQLTLIYTDNGKNGDEFKYIVAGKEVDEVTSENYSYTLPPYLEKVETNAFGNDEQFTDVYVLSEKAPICEVNAFSKGTLYGWGGFKNTNPITRDNYAMYGNKTFAVLHWPSNLPESEVKRYTDITRKYSIQDGLQHTDGNGNTLVWPNQTEYDNAYAQATNGYLWNAWSVGAGPSTTQEQADAYFGENGDSKNVFYSTTKEYDKTEYDADYRGWHQFVLASAINYSHSYPHFDFSKYKSDTWYSICLPFDLDEDEVVNIFGVPAGKTYTGSNGEAVAQVDIMPNLCTLYKVVRNSQLNKITLWFTPNLAENRKDWNLEKSEMTECETRNGKKIIIKAGYPYLIKPFLPEDVKESLNQHAKRLISYDSSNNSKNARDYDKTYKQKLPYRDWFVQAIDQNGQKLQGSYTDDSGNTITTDYKYHFLGTYTSVAAIPMYSYFLASNGTDNVWYYNKWTPKEYSAAWSANTCLVGPMASLILNQNTNINNFSSVTFNFTPHSDDFPEQSTRAKLYMRFDDGSTTEIESISADGKFNAKPLGAIYNLNGQLIRNANSMDNLPKGIYIMNGKKYIVK